ncbi:DUF4249 family protein [Bacteroidota bacterium]
MKKLLYSIITITLFIVCSCQEETLSPKTEFIERYIFTCIVDCDTNYQTATLSASYNVDGFDPYSNTLDPAIEGADIRIWYKDTVFVMRDTVTAGDDVSLYDTPRKFYYVIGLQPERGEILDVEVVLNDGRKLSSATSTSLLSTFFFGDGDQTIPAGEGAMTLPSFNVYWTYIGNSAQSLFVPRLFIIYNKIENGTSVQHTKEVPSDYIQSGDVFNPIFPIGQKSSLVRYQLSAIDRAMREISEGDPNKQNYVISHAFIQLLVLDENLSAYYGSLQIKSDGFTVKVDAPEYSNIEGGLGIFGSYSEKEWNIEIMNDYILSFGYRILSEE